VNDPFNYLSVMISIVLGLAVAHVLGSVVRVINNRHRTILYWPCLLWAFTLFLLIAQLWWADASLNNYGGTWDFATFLVLLAQPAALYALCALILPVPDEAHAFDMKAAFMRNRIWFVGALLLSITISFIKELVLYGHIPLNANFAALSLFAVFCIIMLRFGSDRSQKAGAVVAAAVTIAYIAILFSRLPT
jgi:hypothetical protein